MPTDELTIYGGVMEGFQLWVNLPKDKKMVAPRYQDISPDNIPKAHGIRDLVEVVVIAGSSMDVNSTIETHTPITFLDFRLRAGGDYRQSVPESYSGFVYVYAGTFYTVLCGRYQISLLCGTRETRRVDLGQRQC